MERNTEMIFARLTFLSTLTIALALTLVSCSGGGEEKKATTPPTKQKPVVKMRTGFDLASIPEVVAKIGDKQVKKYRLISILSGIESSMGEAMLKDRAALERLRGDVIEQYINNELFIVKAEQKGIVASEEEVGKQLREAIRKAGGADPFYARLKVSGKNENVVKEEIRNDIVINKLMKTEGVFDVTIPDEILKKYYDENKDEFAKGEIVRLAEIFVKKEKDDNDGAKVKMKLAAVKEALDNGQDFSRVVKELSEDPASAARGGEIGFVERGTVPVLDVVFNLKAGEVADPIEVKVGYHIVKVMEKRPPGILKFSEVKNTIFEKLSRQIRDKQTYEYVNRLRKEFNITIFM